MASLGYCKTNRIQVRLFFYLFVLYRPEYILNYEYLDLLINVLRVVVTADLLFKIVQTRNHNKLIFPIIIWGMFNALCLFNNTWNHSVLIEFFIILDVYILVALYYPYRIVDLYVSLNSLLIIFAICNTWTILIGNEVERLFLGFDNDVVMRIIPLMGVQFFLALKVKNRLSGRDLFVAGLFLLDYVLTRSLSGLISILVMLFLLCNKKVSFKYIKSSSAIIGSIVLWGMLYYGRVQTYFTGLLLMTSKGLTLNYRTYIWESVVTAIKQSIVYGYGNIGANESYYNIVRPMYEASIYPHNIWLYVVASSGIIGFALFVLLIIRSFKRVDRNSKNRANKVLLAALLSYLLCGTFASYYAMEYFCFLLAIASNAGMHMLRESIDGKNGKEERNNGFNFSALL